MGNNPCKQLVEGGGRIQKEDFEALLSRYDKDKNGKLDQDEASKFLKDLCKALGSKYDKHNAARIINRCDKDGKGELSIKEFTALFQEAILEAETAGNAKAKKIASLSHMENASSAPSNGGGSSQRELPAPVPVPVPVEIEEDPNEKRYREAFSGSAAISRNEIELGKLIGSGQFGEVYVAKCRGMECAVKIPNLTLNSAKFDMLLNELEIMKKANCPYVAMFMGACHDQASDKILIVMELMSGDAEKKCKEPEHSLSDRLNWIRQACKGQAWLHEMTQPILHLDLKPSNILFDQRGVFKVCDFGLSAVLPEGEQTLFMNRMRGTPIYMAPEIMIPGEFGITHKSDTYSMAITAWEICTGENCFSEYTSLAPFKNDVHKGGKRPPLPEDWPKSLHQLFHAMWHSNPNARPSFKEIVASLDRIIPEVVLIESRSKLKTSIQNDGGVDWWVQRFPGKFKVDWEEFYPVLMRDLGQKTIQDPTALGEFAEGWALANASLAQLERHAKKGALQRAAVEGELERRKDAHCGSGTPPKTFTDDEKRLLVLKGLIGTTSHNEEGVVEPMRFGQLLAYFGPLDKGLVDRMFELCSQPYFHAFRSSNESQDLLRAGPDGTFLVRFSANRWGQVIISNKVDGKVQHLVIQNNSGVFKYKKTDPGWNSVPALVAFYQESLKLEKPQDGGPFVHMFSEQAHQIAGYVADEDFDDDEYN